MAASKSWSKDAGMSLESYSATDKECCSPGLATVRSQNASQRPLRFADFVFVESFWHLLATPFQVSCITELQAKSLLRLSCLAAIMGYLMSLVHIYFFISLNLGASPF
jgi:hypothetical protein